MWSYNVDKHEMSPERCKWHAAWNSGHFAGGVVSNGHHGRQITSDEVQCGKEGWGASNQEQFRSAPTNFNCKYMAKLFGTF
jgi:hypothetical protein